MISLSLQKMKNRVNKKMRDLNIKKAFEREISLATRIIKDERKYTRKTKHKKGHYENEK